MFFTCSVRFSSRMALETRLPGCISCACKIGMTLGIEAGAQPSWLSCTASCARLVRGLEIWMWERLPVGRPHRMQQPPAWFPEGDTIVAPTVAHLYERTSGVYHVSHHAYISYTNEMDTLQPQHVEWRPYKRERILGLALSTVCRADEDLWTMRCPLICFYAVEYHLPHRYL
ncbi:serine/threonine-protein phosphatase 7 long form homolog [Sorghum bicolor]|uniref:serine/threonine-protein phosphatase 7 long form homolog n=1 Tax=Sorghum bicolor TaxID=4558 RepID=UPI000B426146|nr:serine/threonine-protein phosphatase 7 long form homolog [Sorghum bicolor]|eukprot:XP_021309071.1 serine/threonine-protein phosphatase 7 long form homolog [Sorghum bicolor]